MKRLTLIGSLVVTVIVYSGCTASRQSPTPKPMVTAAAPMMVSPAIPTSTTTTMSLDRFDYPPASSPGATNTAVTQANIHQTICKSGWTATVRPKAAITNVLKRQQMAAEGMIAPLSTVEEDHVVAIEVGGDPQSPRNLFPQPKAGPHGAIAKDHIENEIHRKVCTGAITLIEGQTVFLNHQW